MRRAYATFLMALGMLAITAGAASAFQMDFDRAGAGTRTTYSEMVDAIPTAWDLMVNRTPLTDPTSLQHTTALPMGMDLAENGSGGLLGQIVRVGRPNGANRHVWGVYDRLSAIPTPILLYYHGGSLPVTADSPYDRSIADHPWLGSPAGIRGSGSAAAASASASAASQTSIQPETPITPVPEPTAVALLTLGAAALLLRRR